MRLHPIKLTHLAVSPEQYPRDGLPEVALIGKSNVGKSSLINTLAARKNLAKTSSVPGKTRTINFYRVGDKFYLVDLPGYGYAKAAQSERRNWRLSIEQYFKLSRHITGAVVLLDARRDPARTEHEIYRWTASLGINTLTVFTKADKLSKNRLLTRTRGVARDLGLTEQIAFSSTTGEGKDELIRKITELATNG